MKGKRIIILALIAAAAIALGVMLWGPGKSENSYLTAEVRKADIANTVIATGTVRSSNRVSVGAQVSGKITELAVSLGDQVKQGQLIARIDSTTKENDLKTAESRLAIYRAEFESKKIALDVAQRNFTRMSTLTKTNAISKESYDTARDTLAAARSALSEVEENIKQSEISLNTTKTELGYTTINAPIDGVVISVPVSVGQTVNSSMETPTIVQIADLDTMLIKLEISEGDITKVQPGLHAAFSTLSDPDIRYREPVKSVDPGLTTLTDNAYSESSTSTDAVYYYANVMVANPDGKLRIGMSVEGAVEIASRKDAVVVPTLALTKTPGKTVLFVLDENNQKQERSVETGISDDTLTEIVSGVAPGEKVVLSELKAGEKVGSGMPGPRPM